MYNESDEIKVVKAIKSLINRTPWWLSNGTILVSTRCYDVRIGDNKECVELLHQSDTVVSNNLIDIIERL